MKRERRAGFVNKRSDYYTLGGDEETGRGMAPEGQAILRQSAAEAGVELLEADSLEAMVARKSQLLTDHRARLLVNIGGSHANMGGDPAVLKIGTGPLSPVDGGEAGNGVLAFALENGIPVIHMLNIRDLADRAGISRDSAPRGMAPASASAGWSFLGLALFLVVVLTHRRWKLDQAPS